MWGSIGLGVPDSLGESYGGGNGPVAIASMLLELALRVRAFSARSARKKNSRGDSSVRGTDVGLGGLASSDSTDGEERPCSGLDVTFGLGESTSALLKKLGIGSAEGAGDAWKVEPAKMGADFSLD